MMRGYRPVAWRSQCTRCFLLHRTHLVAGVRCQSQHSLGTSRDKQRSQSNADPNTGSQMSIVESPDLSPHLDFGMNVLEHVKVPEVATERRNRTDMEKEREMRAKFGEYGPGERLTKSSQQARKDMLAEQQDVDGLPWEVRWKKTLIPTSEEVIQDIRDRFDLYIQDPIEREQEWYLHWKDRAFKVQKDRMIWPQGYTDYLDHYDEHGRRRVLPTEQRWSDSSWKHLADTKYKDRMWLIEGEERKAVHQSLQSDRALMEEEEQRQLEMGDVYHSIVSGIVDLDPQQTYQALSGTADPLEVAKTKMKIQAYGARQALLHGKPSKEPVEIDPISGFPKADMEPLPTGITVEQASAIAGDASYQQEMIEQSGLMAHEAGRDAALAVAKAHHDTSKQYGDKPIVRAQVEARMEQIKQLQKAEAKGQLDVNKRKAMALGEAVAQLEEGILKEEGGDVTHADSGSSAPSSSSTLHARASGFIEVGERPQNAEPDIPNELCHVPQTHELSGMPQWYKDTLIETQPLIKKYGLVHDPLEEKQPEREYYVPPQLIDEDRITNDDAESGVSAFDEIKMHKLRTLPELVEGYKPLPLFRDVTPDGAIESAAATKKEETAAASLDESKAKVVEGKGKPLSKSAALRKERQERLRKSKLQYDRDILLPSLPWETDSVVDPYRGVEEEDAVDFNKKNLEKTWRAYRESFQQTLTEFGNLTQVTSEDKCEEMLFDTMERFRNGLVGDHPEIPEEQEAVFKLIFEGHTKHFLADFYKYKGNRVTEANTVKTEADEILRRASAKSKLLGRNFMNFIQEMTSLELDTIRKNPVQRYVVMVRDHKYEVIAKPFMKWISSELAVFIVTDFQTMEQLETHREFLVRHVKDTRLKCPMRVEGVTDSARDAAVEAFYQWCRGAACYYAARHLHNMFLNFADTRFRSHAEGLFEDSIEWFSNYAKAGRDIVQIPIPDCDPPYEYDEKEFLDGENAILAELSGNIDKAEAIWHSGSTKRWYPMMDETEYLWFNERRGRLTLALDISDRCLENVNKKTHPSIHPFPERARVFLEGAPLTQETAEHLWLRYMGDLYWEHSEFMFRHGRYQTGRSYRDKCVNLYHMAIRTAMERLPPSWRAPLLTKAKYLMRVYSPGETDVDRHLAEVEMVVAQLFETREPPHWIEPFSDLPFRLALVHANLSAYGEKITKEVKARMKWQPTNEMLMHNMEGRARGGETLPELAEYFKTVNEVADTLFRNKILQWRAKEYEGSDPYLFWTHLYFTFRVYPKGRDEVQKMWDLYEPAFLYIYTHCALASRPRGQRLINDALRRICQILVPGDRAQNKILMDELTKVREKMSHFVDRKELDRTINALDAHLSDPSKPTYIYGTALIYKEAMTHERIANNPLLRSQMASKDYEELQRRQVELRVNGTTLNPQQAAKMQEGQGLGSSDDEPIGTQPDASTKEMFERQ